MVAAAGGRRDHAPEPGLALRPADSARCTQACRARYRCRGARRDRPESTRGPTTSPSRTEYGGDPAEHTAKYQLWVTPTERNAMTRILTGCPRQPARTGGAPAISPVAVNQPHRPAPTPESPAGRTPASSDLVYYPNCGAVRDAASGPGRRRHRLRVEPVPAFGYGRRDERPATPSTTPRAATPAATPARTRVNQGERPGTATSGSFVKRSPRPIFRRTSPAFVVLRADDRLRAIPRRCPQTSC